MTFLPFADFAASARVLDTRRLGKHGSEPCRCCGPSPPDYGWRHDPAVKMWRGFEEALTRMPWRSVENGAGGAAAIPAS